MLFFFLFFCCWNNASSRKTRLALSHHFFFKKKKRKENEKWNENTRRLQSWMLESLFTCFVWSTCLLKKKKVLQATKRAFHDKRSKGLRCWCIQTLEHLGCSGVVQLCKGVILPECVLGLLLVHAARGLRRNFFVFDYQFRIPSGMQGVDSVISFQTGFANCGMSIWCKTFVWCGKVAFVVVARDRSKSRL